MRRAEVTALRRSSGRGRHRVITSTLFRLFVLPVLYLFGGRKSQALRQAREP